MLTLRTIFVLMVGWLIPLTGFAEVWMPQSTYTACFTPQENCTAQIVQAIDHAKRIVRVQAYSFTSKPIGNALLAARRRGVRVEVLFDKTNTEAGHDKWLHIFVNHGIPVWIDHIVAIAHNKVMIIDEDEVVTGSFNFTYQAQFGNAENVLIIRDPRFVQYYLNNWRHRQQLSQLYR